MKRPGCLFGRHAPPIPYNAVRGDDAWYGECPFCMTEIMKHDHDRWREMPANMRLVWHRGKPSMVERRGSSARNLPAVQSNGGWLARLFRR